MKHERHCIISPNKHIYSYCPRCDAYNKDEKWRLIYCSENCKSIYEIFDKYRTKNITASKAYTELNKLDLPDMNDINDVVRPTIEEILKNGKPKKKKIVNEINE